MLCCKSSVPKFTVPQSDQEGLWNCGLTDPTLIPCRSGVGVRRTTFNTSPSHSMLLFWDAALRSIGLRQRFFNPDSTSASSEPLPVGVGLRLFTISQVILMSS